MFISRKSAYHFSELRLITSPFLQPNHFFNIVWLWLVQNNFYCGNTKLSPYVIPIICHQCLLLLKNPNIHFIEIHELQILFVKQSSSINFLSQIQIMLRVFILNKILIYVYIISIVGWSCQSDRRASQY